ncbi:hypothetical protein Q7C36_001984 [Tachysurus vachellii]|uniref:Uncharacterized protein n=1 Tax=Tachysurus vachellii TaxID=175792 RepID=A0AA88NS19_TACVA|nr:hypothetical protein Q7C36_001984 [Tachysurus vachellii]
MKILLQQHYTQKLFQRACLNRQSPVRESTNDVGYYPQRQQLRPGGTPQLLCNNSSKTKGEQTQGEVNQVGEQVMTGCIERKTISL